MSRHASLDDLASFIEGTLRGRKTGRISLHLTECTRCTGHVQELRQVSVLLESASHSFPAIPSAFSHRIEIALAAESVTRISAEPESGEASRKDLPVRSRPRRRRWHMPGLSSPLAGSLAAVGAAVVIAGGGYAIATHYTSPAATGSGSSSGVAHPPTAQRHSNAAADRVPAGRDIQLNQHGQTRSVQVVHTKTDFRPAGLQAQALDALRTARTTGLNAAAGTLKITAPLATAGASSTANGGTAQLRGCVGKIANGRNVLLVDIAKYEGSPATIIVIGAPLQGPGTIYVVASGCTPAHQRIIAHQSLP